MKCMNCGGEWEKDPTVMESFCPFCGARINNITDTGIDIETAVRKVMDVYGPGILADRARFISMLAAAAPNLSRERMDIATALGENVGDIFLEGSLSHAEAVRCAKLRLRPVMSEYSADKVIRALAGALGWADVSSALAGAARTKSKVPVVLASAVACLLAVSAGVMIFAGGKLSGGGKLGTSSGREVTDTSSSKAAVTTAAADSAKEDDSQKTTAADESKAETKADSSAAVTTAVGKTSSENLTPGIPTGDVVMVNSDDLGNYTNEDGLNYYYAHMDRYHQKIYEVIYDMIINTNDDSHASDIYVSEDTIWTFSEDIYWVFACVMDDYPEFFRYDELCNTSWDYYDRSHPEDGYYKLKIYQIETMADFNEELSELDRAASEFLADMPGYESEYDKALWVHDKLLDTVEYLSDEKESNGIMYSQTAYSALVRGTAVCEGYADAYSYLLRRCGICCLPIEGGVGSGDTYDEAYKDASQAEACHTWNLVRLDGTWYETDVTWDDHDYSKHSEYVLSLIDKVEGLREKRAHIFWAKTPAEMRDVSAEDELTYYTEEDGKKYSLAFPHEVHIRASNPDAYYYSESGSYNYRKLSEMLPE